ncbi:MAG: hypothetical protein RL701_4105 [Pseudomonadota bacterium]
MAKNFFDAYLAGETRAFLPWNVRERRDREHVVTRAVGPLAPEVFARIRDQNALYGPSTARAHTLGQLEAGARVVVTGQQVGLFLGPLYTVYKAATAVRLAQQLAEETGKAVVPIFWLQTEDHDLPEIATVALPRADEDPFVIAPEIARDNRCSIAQLALPAAIGGSIAQLRLELERLPHAQEHLARIARHYRVGHGWSAAFAHVLAELFEPTGLLILDPRDSVFAQHSAWVHARALERASDIEAILQAQSERLNAAGFAATVQLRAGSPLSFYHARGPLGPRTRLVQDAGQFVDPRSGERHTLAALLETLQREPLSFSTSALLRPILQDALLPTAAYVGGPAELAYLAQLTPLYETFGLEPPLAAPRARFRLIEPRAARILTRRQLTASVVTLSEEQLLARITPHDAATPPSAAVFEAELTRGFDQVLQRAASAWPEAFVRELAPHKHKTQLKLQTSAHKLAARYAATLLQRDASCVRDVRALRRWLQPQGAPQERVFGYSYYAARYGERALLEQILRATDPLATSITELQL